MGGHKFSKIGRGNCAVEFSTGHGYRSRLLQRYLKFASNLPKRVVGAKGLEPLTFSV